jgi:hypothetical protein
MWFEQKGCGLGVVNCVNSLLKSLPTPLICLYDQDSPPRLMILPTRLAPAWPQHSGSALSRRTVISDVVN